MDNSPNKKIKINNEEKIYLTIDEIKSYQQQISSEYSNIRKLEEQIKSHQKNIDKYSRFLVINCKHNKIPDRGCYDRTTYYCDICNQDL
jgi:hypothetical protein